MTKLYELPDGHRLIADIDESTMTCIITETQLNSLIRNLNYYADKCKEYEEQEPSVEIVKTEESNDNDTKYLNINVSDDEVKRNPDIVRLCSDVGVLEYAKPQIGHWIDHQEGRWIYAKCSECETIHDSRTTFCPNCGAKMVEPQESEGAE